MSRYQYSAFDLPNSKFRYSDEAFFSALSLKRFTDAPISLTVNDECVASKIRDHYMNPFSEIRVDNMSLTAKEQKIRVIKNSLDEQTVYLDTHTVLFGSLESIFEIGNFDVAGVPPPSREFVSPVKVTPSQEALFGQSLNTGVLFLRSTQATQALCSKWLASYLKLRESKGDAVQDQGSFTQAVSQLEIGIKSLPNNFNFRANYGGLLSGKLFVLHTHCFNDIANLAARNFDHYYVRELLDLMDEFYNGNIGSRVYEPLQQTAWVDAHLRMTREVGSGRGADASQDRPKTALKKTAAVHERLARLDEIGMINLSSINTVIDVGVGETGSGFLTKVLSRCNFICFEANPDLEGKVEKFYPDSRSDFYFIGLAATPGQRELLFGTQDFNKGTFLRANKWSPAQKGEEMRRDIECFTLDQMRPNFRYGGPYLLKIDVEGLELDVLHGAEALLSEVAILILEVGFIRRFESSYDFSEMLSFLHSIGFRAVDICYLPSMTLTNMPIRRVDMVFARA